MQIRMNCSKVRHETHSSLLAKIKQKPFSISIIFFCKFDSRQDSLSTAQPRFGM